MGIKLFAYRRGNSIIHKIPPFIKILFLMIFCIVTFAGGAFSTIDEIFSIPVIIRTVITFVISICLFFLSKANYKSIKNLFFVLILGAAVTVFRMFYFGNYETKYIIMITHNFGIDINGLAGGVLYTIRFFTTSLVAQIIFETTSSLEIKDSFESSQAIIAKFIPIVKKIDLALILSLAISFIPMIFEMWNKIHLASRARSKNCKIGIIGTIAITLKELEALLSCLLYKAEIKRLALLNRSESKD